MSILIMDQRRTGLPVVSIVNPKTGNTKLIINEIDFVPGKNIRWEDFLNEQELLKKEAASVDAVQKNTAPSTNIGVVADTIETDTAKEDEAPAKKERVARAQREKDIRATVEDIPETKEGGAI